jgi:hypothetical protein
MTQSKIRQIDFQGHKLILSLQLLIARAAQKDSLRWWEDDSLTPSGKYLLERLFPVNPEEAGYKLALEAAKVRYQAAFSDTAQVLHLFHLDQTGDVEHSMQGIRLSNLPILSEPIQTIDALRHHLLELVGSQMKYQVVSKRPNNCLEIKMGDKSPNPDVIQIVKTLAWATLEGEPGKPIFPYIINHYD